jgi:tetratricopeptide (TPR) repeat protein
MSLDDGDRPLHRDAGDPVTESDTALKPHYARSWAALIGINDYADQPLKTAAADAVGMAKMLIERHDFPPGNVFLLISSSTPLPPALDAWLAAIRPQLAGGLDERPTKRAIERLLFTTLPARTGADDRVVVYFAGHGAPQLGPDGKLENARPYLMPIDARPSQWEELIELDAIERQSPRLPAKHAFYIFDACCSGLFGHRSGAPAVPAVYNPELLRHPARHWISAGTSKQYVRDRGHDGHSVFTWHLLQMLQDDKLFAAEGYVGFYRLATELKDRVPRDRLAEQTPDFGTLEGHDGGEFVLSTRAVPPSVDELIRTGELLIEQIGRCLDDPSPIAFASALWRQVRAADTATPAQRAIARREQGRCLLLLGDLDGALQELAAGELRDDAEAALLRAMAQLRRRRLPAACAELAALTAMAPDHRYAAWAARAIEAIRQPRGRRRALLIGVDRIPQLGTYQPAAANDVAAMQDLLVHELGFQAEDIAVLTGVNATRARIAHAFEHMNGDLASEDTFVCYYCGVGALDRGVTVYSTYDLDQAAGIQWTETDFDAAMRSLPAHDKLLITDGCHLAPASTAERAGYRFVFGCQRDEKGWEITDDRGAPRGAFSLALERAVRMHGNAPLEQLIEQATAELATRPQLPQTPGYTGSGRAHMVERPPAWLDVLELAEQSHRRFTSEQIDELADWLASGDRGDAGMGPLWFAVGRAQLARRSYEAATDALRQSNHPLAALPLVQAALCCGRYATAFEHWGSWRAAHERAPLDDESAQLVAALQPLLERIRAGVRRVLIVVTDPEGDDKLLQQVVDLQTALKQRWGLQHFQVQVLQNARKGVVIASFEEFAQASRDAPALFLFIGPGFDGPEVWLSTASETGQLSDLCLADLRLRATGCAHLTSALVFTRIYVPSGVSEPLPSWNARPEQSALGRGMLIATPHHHRDIAVRDEPLDLDTLDVLIGPRRFPLTLNAWRERIAHTRSVTIRGNREATVLSYHEHGNCALDLLRTLEQAPLRRMVEPLQRLADHGKLADDARLQLAIVQLQLQRPEQALKELAKLDEAVARHCGATPGNGQTARPATPGDARWLAEVHYWRGRVLMCLERYWEAGHNLAEAVKNNPDHARAHRHRADAIQRLIETDLGQQLRDSVQQYIRLGAPMGLDDLPSPPSRMDFR